MEKSKHPFFKTAVIGLKLLLVCALVAGVVSFVYSLTYEQYERNKQATKDAAVGEIFEAPTATCTELAKDGKTAVYGVVAEGATLGYCVEVLTSGFGGDMELMIGYDAEGRVLGVRVVAHSETPGLGENVKNDSFLSQFVGKDGEIHIGSDLDAISGATISSRAVTDGVNLATEALQKFLMEGEVSQ